MSEMVEGICGVSYLLARYDGRAVGDGVWSEMIAAESGVRALWSWQNQPRDEVVLTSQRGGGVVPRDHRERHSHGE
jgi:hypothetical protein